VRGLRGRFILGKKDRMCYSKQKLKKRKKRKRIGESPLSESKEEEKCS